MNISEDGLEQQEFVRSTCEIWTMGKDGTGEGSIGANRVAIRML